MPVIGTRLRSEDVGPQDVVGEAPLMIRLIVSLIAAVVMILADQAHAQAPLEAQWLSSERADACHKGFAKLRDEAERRGRLVKEASNRKAPREEAWGLIRKIHPAAAHDVQVCR